MSDVNKMPEVLNDYRVYDENGSTLYGIAKFELPDFKSITQTIKGVGIGGEIEAPVLGQFESLETKITHNINSDWNLKLVGGQAVALEARGANQYWDSGANKYVMDTVRVVIRGRSKAMAGGSWEPASTVDATNTTKRRTSSMKSMVRRCWKLTSMPINLSQAARTLCSLFVMH